MEVGPVDLMKKLRGGNLVSTDLELEQEIKKRLCDRYTPSEFIELLDVSIYELVEEYFLRIPDFVLEELR